MNKTVPCQQNGKSLPRSSQMQNVAANGVGSMNAGGVGRGTTSNMMSLDPDIARTRSFMQEKIFAIIMQRQVHPVDEQQKQRYKNFAERVEGGLFKFASNKEEYMNLSTLEVRMRNLLKRTTHNNNGRRSSPNDNSSSFSTMIPTPGLTHGENSSSVALNTKSAMNSSVTTELNTNHKSYMNGAIRNGYQPSNANISRSSGVNLPSSCVQRTGTQMIPTPGFNSSKNSHALKKIESSSIAPHSNGESAMASPPRQQKQRMLQGTSFGANMNPTMPRKPFSDMAMAPNKLQNINGYLNGSSYSDSSKALHPQQLVQGDSSGTKNSEFFVSRSFCGGASSSGSIDLPHSNSSPIQASQPFSKQNSRGINVQSEKLTCENSQSDHSSQIQQRQLNHNLMTNKDGSISHSTMNLQAAEMQSQEDQSAPEQCFRSTQNLAQSSHQQHLSSGKRTDFEMEGQSHLTAADKVCGVNEQLVKDDFHYRISGQDDAQPNSMAVDGPTACLNVNTRSEVGDPSSTNSVLPSGNDHQDTQFKRQQMWLLFLLHARSCTYVEGKCPSGKPCSMAQKLLKHMNGCNAGGTGSACAFPRCLQTRKLIYHYKRCKETSCPVCGPVRLHGAQINSRSNIVSPPVIAKDSSSTKDGSSKLKPNCRKGEDLDEVISSKRIKVEHTTVKQENNGNHSSAVNYNGNFSGMGVQPPHVEATMFIKQEVKLEISSNKNVNVQDVRSCQRSCKDKVKDEFACFPKAEIHNAEKKMDSSKEDTKTIENFVCPKLGKPKIKGVSLTELFTPDQVKEHILSLRQWVGQSKAKAEKNQAMEHLISENSCQLCAVERLSFEPPPIYCSLCGIRIKRNAMYYTAGAGETRHYFCIPCYNDSRGDTLTLDGVSIPKHKVEKKKNEEETEEWWVQCDKCEAWQHQICALFNGRRNEGGQAEYTCPNCYIAEIEKGERKPLPQNSVLGAKDLPCTILSDHIEQRLFKRLKHERHERARAQGKAFDEVPTADPFVVRVVSSVDKKLDVKPRFLEIFREENYPTEFPYKSKVILLFQNIEGVEVCLFGMYVQEFGTDSQCPNQRRVYLSYLDSVKYFRPDIKTVHGEALRTFVYHEILIGYLEYCKKRGFTNCYIWACPPLKGEDYILYCHPEIQKTPKSDKLREWYLSMLKKATKENIVVDLTNLYDHFFVSTGECRAKVTATRLPYFDGDYWPGAAEDLIYQFNQEDDGKKQNKKGSGKKTITKRTLKSSELSSTASKDLLLMQKLGETISPMKEDFIMVHLQHCCTHCCNLMVSGQRWVCKQCKKFQLCDKCYEEEQKRDDREQHPINQREKHTLHSVEISGVPEDTKDVDEILESEFFDTRQAFLSLCQGNHYQYDTLRRAKHSSMMILYHLHNPTAPAFVTSCNACHLDIETGQGWRCEVCPDYDICNACYSKDGGISHPHKLTNHPSLAENDDQNKEARQLRVLQLRKMLGLLVHAAQCRSATCPYPNCRKVKGLFRHGFQCRVRATGGCVLCKKMWYLLQLHARACKEKDCNVPRCKDLKEHVRRLQQQSDSRRRAAVMEMMRQRAAEVSGN